MAERCIIGIDVGTSGVKVLAIDEQAAILASVIEEYPLYTPQAGWTEQEPEDWWQATAKCLRQVMAQLRDRTIAAIGLSGQMHGMVALDKDDRVVRRAILWNDQRTAGSARKSPQPRAG
jgi:xylulokinase